MRTLCQALPSDTLRIRPIAQSCPYRSLKTLSLAFGRYCEAIPAPLPIPDGSHTTMRHGGKVTHTCTKCQIMLIAHLITKEDITTDIIHISS